MKKWLLRSVGLGILLLILGVGLILGCYGRSFSISKTSSETFTVEMPVQTVAINLLMSDVSSKISQRLGVGVLEKKTVEKTGDISLPSFLSGKWNARQVEESSCEMQDANLGTLLLKIRATMEASPEKIVTVTELSESAGALEEMVQVVTITPVPAPEQESKKPAGKGLMGMVSGLMGGGKQSGKTEIGVEYTTSIRVEYPALPFIRTEAEKRLALSHEKTMQVLVETLREYATTPDMTLVK
ncbi:MAG: hypothetical protein Q4E67_00765 [Planctomycetia bacterium]|nr:hypothetical protein [Planctomycetia bacterium]